MSCCRPSSCSIAALVVGGFMASGALVEWLANIIPRHILGVSIWIWLAILVVVGLIAFFTVSPAPREEDPAEPPPGADT